MNKRLLFNYVVGLLALLSLTSCPSDDGNDEGVKNVELQVSPSSVTLDDQNSGSITISSNTSWSIFSSESWLTTSTAEGFGNFTVSISATGNNTGSTARTGTLTIRDKGGQISVTVTVTQNPPPKNYHLTIDKTAMNFEAVGGEDKITVSSDDEWTVSSSQVWCKAVPVTEMVKPTEINVSVEKNNSTESRTATITVTGTNSGIQQTVMVSQKGEDYYLTLNKNAMDFDETGGSSDFTISTNDEWIISGTTTWCRVSATSGQSGTNTVTITVDSFTDSNNRSTTITVTGKKSNIKQTVTVSQNGVSDPSDIGLNGFGDDIELGAYTLSASPTSLSFSAAGESKTISTQGNDIWTASSNKSWCTLSKASGTAGESIVVTVSKNTSSSSRSATITITGAHTSPVTVSVTQAKPEEEDSDIGRNDFDSDVNLNKK